MNVICMCCSILFTCRSFFLLHLFFYFFFKPLASVQILQFVFSGLICVSILFSTFAMIASGRERMEKAENEVEIVCVTNSIAWDLWYDVYFAWCFDVPSSSRVTILLLSSLIVPKRYRCTLAFLTLYTVFPMRIFFCNLTNVRIASQAWQAFICLLLLLLLQPSLPSSSSSWFCC